jgi:hypothetical protein
MKTIKKLRGGRKTWLWKNVGRHREVTHLGRCQSGAQGEHFFLKICRSKLSSGYPLKEQISCTLWTLSRQCRRHERISGDVELKSVLFLQEQSAVPLAERQVWRRGVYSSKNDSRVLDSLHYRFKSAALVTVHFMESYTCYNKVYSI